MRLSTCERCGVPFEGTGRCSDCDTPDPHQDPAYRRAKYKRKQMAGGRCEGCGRRASLDCHHMDGNPNNHALSNLRMLCAGCHEPITQAMKHGRTPPQLVRYPIQPEPLRRLT